MHPHFDLAKAIQQSRLEDAERARIARAARRRRPAPELPPPTLLPVPDAGALSDDGWQEAFAELEQRFRESA